MYYTTTINVKNGDKNVLIFKTNFAFRFLIILRQDEIFDRTFRARQTSFNVVAISGVCGLDVQRDHLATPILVTRYDLAEFQERLTVFL